jgi:glutathione S-transferase
VSPDQPSPESKKLAESLVLLEFVADLYPNSTLLPKDPVARAQARFFIDAISTKFSPGYGAFIRGETFDKFFEGVKAIQSLLPANGKYALGDEFTIADAAILPFLARGEVALSNDIGKYPEGEGHKAYQKLSSDPEYARFWKYFNDLKDRESFKKTFDPVSNLYLSLISTERCAMHRIISRKCILFALPDRKIQ